MKAVRGHDSEDAPCLIALLFDETTCPSSPTDTTGCGTDEVILHFSAGAIGVLSTSDLVVLRCEVKQPLLLDLRHISNVRLVAGLQNLMEDDMLRLTIEH